MPNLHEFSKTSVDKDCSDISGFHENELFFNCDFDKIAGVTLKDCDLNRSRFNTSSIRDALGFTLTLSCHSFNAVQYSPLLVELLLYLLTTTKGNDEYRAKIAGILGEVKMESFSRVLKGLE